MRIKNEIYCSGCQFIQQSAQFQPCLGCRAGTNDVQSADHSVLVLPGGNSDAEELLAVSGE